MSAANKKFQTLIRKVHAWKAHDYVKDKEFEEASPKNITTSEVRCSACGFKARYKFIRCPECGESQKE